MSIVPGAGETFRSDDGTVSTVLPETADPNYEPAQDELEEYAEFLGIDLDKEPGLMWIAKEGLRTPLPGEWRACQTDDDEIYYFNFKTGESLWDHPMDDVFKNKVQKEREKLKQQGGDSGKNTQKKPSAAASANTSVNSGKGSTKAISNSLFGGPKNAPGAAPGKLAQPIAGVTPGRLGAIGGGGGPATAALTSGRGPLPDVSSILPPPGASSLSLESARPLGGIGGGGGLLGSKMLASAAPKKHVVQSAKDIENSIRKRVDEEYVAQRRAMSIEHDKKEIEERRRLDEALKAYRAKLEKDRQAGTSTGPASRLEEEVKKTEESWASRIQQTTTRIMTLRSDLGRKKEEAMNMRGGSVEELKKQLVAKQQREVEIKRQTLQQKHDEELAQMLREQADALAEVERRGSAEVTATRTRIEQENKKKQEFQELQAQKMIDSLEAEVNAKKAQLAEATARAQQQQQGSSNSTTTTAAATAGDGDARIKEAEAKAAAMIEEAGDAAAAAVIREKAACRRRVEALEKEIEEKKKAATAPAPKLKDSPLSDTIGSTSLSPEEGALLKQEEEALRKAMEDELKSFLIETDTLVKQKQNEISSKSPSLSTSTAATPQGTPTTQLVMSAAQETRTREAEITRHLSALQQLELKHEKAIRLLREAHQKELVKKAYVDPRKSATYTKQITDRKREWLLANPPPTQQLPKLDPIPKLSAAVMGDLPEIEPPNNEARQAHLRKCIEALRTEMSEMQNTKLHELEETSKAELDAIKEDYRATRLKAVQESLDSEEREALRAAQSQSADISSKQAAAAASAAAADAAAKQEAASMAAKAAALRSRVQQADADHATRAATLTSKIEGVERDIVQARRDYDAASAAVAAAVSSAQQQQPSHATPIPEEGGVEVEEEEVIVSQPDFVNYISNDDATCIEEMLHKKWQGILAALLSSYSLLQQSTSADLQQQQQQHYASTTTAGGAGGGHNTTSTYDISAATPPVDVSVTVVGGVGGNDRQQHGGGAMQNRPPLAATATPKNTYNNYNSPMPASVSYHPDEGSEFGGYPRQSLNASTIRASPKQNNYNNYFKDPNGSGGALLTPFMSNSGLHMPYYSTGGEPQVLLRPQSTPIQAMTPAMDAELHRVAMVYVQRLSSLRAALKQWRRELHRRQARIEGLRNEWRADIRRCREEKNKTDLRSLKAVKAQLEEEARDLNAAVTSLKDAHHKLRVEEERLALELPQFAHLFQSTKGGGSRDAPAMAMMPTPTAADDSEEAVLRRLMRMVQRTEDIEVHLLNHAMQDERSQQPTAQPRPKQQQRHAAAADAKVSKTTKQQASTSAPQQQQQPEDRSKGKVEQWLSGVNIDGGDRRS